MNATELRIGNLVLFKEVNIENGECLWKPVEVASRDVWNLQNGSTQIKDSYQGIPLTEELLIKCGFEKHKFESSMIGYIKEPWCIYLGVYENGGEPCSFRYNVDDWYYPEIAQFKYLHQLQNLYFALTRTELEIQL